MKLTGDTRADADILAFIKARQNLLQQRGLLVYTRGYSLIYTLIYFKVKIFRFLNVMLLYFKLEYFVKRQSACAILTQFNFHFIVEHEK